MGIKKYYRITENSIIKNVTQRKKSTISIDGNILKKLDTLIFDCQICGKTTQQLFTFKEKFIQRKFICQNCLTKQTNLQKYGVEYTLQLDEVKRKTKQTNLKKYGTEHHLQNVEILDKQKQTVREKYGVENVSQLETVQEKIKHTSLERFGFTNANKSLQVKEKIKQTNLKKYGVDNPLKSKEIREKIKQTNLKKYGTFYPMQLKKMRDKIHHSLFKTIYKRLIESNRLQDRVTPLFNIENYNGVLTVYKWKCNKCGNIFEDHLDDGRIPRCFICYPIPKIGTTSKYEQELYNWLKSFNIKNVEQNNRQLIKPYEIDLYLPDYKLALEFNGIYYHSIEFITDKWYHQKKVELCYRKGIRLLHIWENEWIENKNKVKKHILYYINNMNEWIKVEKPILLNIENNLKIWM